MTYSANDHPVDTLGLVIEVIEEAEEQAESNRLQEHITELMGHAENVREIAQEECGESPTQKLLDAIENRDS